jgi:hypothetical protein
MSAPRIPRGFTMFEVLGVLLVTSILLAAAISFYRNLTHQAARAADSTREVRRAGALIDKIAADLEHTLLVKKPEDADPLSRPWLFLAQSRYSQPGEQRGADQLKFIRRESPRASDGPASDVAMVAYVLERSEDGENFALYRWSTSELPESLERELPRSDDPDSLLLADDLRYFALRFLDEAGEWKDHWDSTELVDTSELPLAVEIEVALAPPQGAVADPELEQAEPLHYAREVALPLRPLDLEALFDKDKKEGVAKNGEEGEGAGGKTLAECLVMEKLPMQGAEGLSASDVATLSAALQNNPTASFKQYAGAFAALAASGAINPDCL